MTDISIVTLNYKEADLTMRCVKSLLKSKKVTLEILVIDNSCDIKDEERLKVLKGKKIKIHTMKKNLGCAGGYNFGIRHAKGKYVFIMNNDAEITGPLELSKMKRFLDSNSKVAVIQPKIKSFQNKKKFDYAGAAGGYVDIYGYPFCRGRLFQTTETDRGQYDDVTDISWASTCAFFARKKILKEVGLFDPIYFAYAEEVDMSIKIWNSGYKVQSFPHAAIYHRGESSWRKQRAKKTFLIHRNHFILFFKCYSRNEIIFLLPLRLIYEVASIGFYIVTGRSHFIIPIFKSYIAILTLLPKILKRRKIFFRNFHKNSMPKYKRSIITSYYLFGNKKFSKLNKDVLYG